MANGFRVRGIAHDVTIAGDEISKFQYIYTTRGWQELVESGGRAPFRNGQLEWADDGRPEVVFSLPVEAGEVAHLEGAFHSLSRCDAWLWDGATNYAGYAFAVPDEHDLRAIEAGIDRMPAPSG
jgi:hypothetical protein